MLSEPATLCYRRNGAAPPWNSGQIIDGSNGPNVPATNATGSLDVAHKALQANAGYD